MPIIPAFSLTLSLFMISGWGASLRLGLIWTLNSASWAASIARLVEPRMREACVGIPPKSGTFSTSSQALCCVLLCLLECLSIHIQWTATPLAAIVNYSSVFESTSQQPISAEDTAHLCTPIYILSRANNKTFYRALLILYIRYPMHRNTESTYSSTIHLDESHMYSWSRGISLWWV